MIATFIGSQQPSNPDLDFNASGIDELQRLKDTDLESPPYLIITLAEAKRLRLPSNNVKGVFYPAPQCSVVETARFDSMVEKASEYDLVISQRDETIKQLNEALKSSSKKSKKKN
jgi:hypothetical protein